jgi:transcriptional regulator with XRE-family HTH domain
VGRTIFTPEHRALTAVLRAMREEAGVRQVELAERLDRPQSYVSKYETGERRLDLVELRAICLALDVPLVSAVDRFEKAARKARRK